MLILKNILMHNAVVFVVERENLVEQQPNNKTLIAYSIIASRNFES